MTIITHKPLRTAGALALSLSVLALAACDDPAKNKTKAETSEAIPTASVAQPSAAEAAAMKTFTFDGSSSKVEWVGSKVTGKHDGGFKTFNGTIKAPEGAPEKGSVEVTIDTTSVFSDAEKLTQHLMSKDFFDTAAHPKATFTSTKIDKGGQNGATHTVTGNLNLHGVTKGINFPATIKMEGDSVSVDAEFTINRKEFGILYAGKADDLIRDDVVIKLAIKGKKS